MSSPVYTERFVRAYAANVTVVYTVPAGKRAVVRNVVAVNPSNNVVTIGVSVDGYYVVYGDLQGHGGNVMAETRVVAYAGNLIQATCYSAGASVIVSGYLFDDHTGAAKAAGELVAEASTAAPLEPAAGSDTS